MTDERDPVHMEVQIPLKPLTFAVSLEKAYEMYEEYYESKGLELHEDEPDPYQLWDWINNNMDHGDFIDSKLYEIVAGPVLMRECDYPDVKEHWGDAPKRIVDYEGNVLHGDSDFEPNMTPDRE